MSKLYPQYGPDTSYLEKVIAEHQAGIDEVMRGRT